MSFCYQLEDIKMPVLFKAPAFLYFTNLQQDHPYLTAAALYHYRD